MAVNEQGYKNSQAKILFLEETAIEQECHISGSILHIPANPTSLQLLLVLPGSYKPSEDNQ